MAAKVRELGADIGIALDGDGDRLIVADEHGNIVGGDHVMAICAADLISRKKLKKKTLVTTVMSNLGLEVAMQRLGGAMLRTQVGDRYVVEEMRKSGYNFGGEQSGHLVFMEHSTTGDGILAALQLLAVMIKKQKPLSELATIMESFPQVLKNVRTTEKINTASIPGFTEKIKKMEAKLGKDGRILVRPSGTEPLIRVMVEGKDAELINAMADELCEMVRKADIPESVTASRLIT
jgi:phosphoglucosamine mutase